MILVFDVGNTETTIGLFAGDALRAHWRVTTDSQRTPDEVALQVRALLASDGIDSRQVYGVAVGSVVPAMTGTLVEAAERVTGAEPVVVDATSPLPITLDVEGRSQTIVWRGLRGDAFAHPDVPEVRQARRAQETLRLLMERPGLRRVR